MLPAHAVAEASSLERALYRVSAQREVHIQQAVQHTARLRGLQADLTLLGQVADVLATLSMLKQEKATYKIEQLVTKGLRAVFDDMRLEFRLVWDRSGTAMTCTPCLLEDGQPAPILDCEGGGVADVVGFCLRTISIVLVRPKMARVLIADEPFQHVRGAHYQDNLAVLIRMLHEVTGIQFILVSDVGSADALKDAADIVLLIEKHKGQATWRKVEQE